MEGVKEEEALEWDCYVALSKKKVNYKGQHMKVTRHREQ